MIKMTTAHGKMSELDNIAGEIAKRIDNSRFEHVLYGVNGEQKEGHFYSQPAKTSSGVVSENPLGDEFYLLNKAGELAGLSLTFPDVHWTLEAGYSKQKKNFRKNVFDTYWFRNGFLAQKTSDRVDIRKVLGARFVDEEIRKPSEQAVIDKEGKKLLEKQTPSSDTVLQTQYIVGPSLQTEMPTRTGRFDDFKGVIPVDAELKSEGKARWYGSYFYNDNLSAVRSDWLPFDGVLSVYSDWPLGRYSGGVLPIFSEKNPKK